MSVQAGPNIQLGGLKAGLARLSYQGPGRVAKPIARPMEATAITNTASATRSDIGFCLRRTESL